MTIGFSRVALLLPIALGFAPACGRNDKDMPTSSPRGAPGNQVAAVVQGADEDDDRPDTRKRKGWNDKAVNPFRQAEEYRNRPTDDGEEGAEGAAAEPQAPEETMEEKLEKSLRSRMGSLAGCAKDRDYGDMDDAVSLTVSVFVTTSGRVSSAEVSGHGLPEHVTECMRTRASSLTLMSPEEPTSVSTTLEFKIAKETVKEINKEEWSLTQERVNDQGIVEEPSAAPSN